MANYPPNENFIVSFSTLKNKVPPKDSVKVRTMYKPVPLSTVSYPFEVIFLKFQEFQESFKYRIHPESHRSNCETLPD